MPITEKLREFIRKHPTDAIITRGDLLAFGHRIAVDNAIYHLVNRTGELVRIARGLFIKKERITPVTVLEAVKAKCRRFGKVVITSAETAAHKLGISDRQPIEPVFAATGRTTSFMFQGKRITTRGTSPRKMALGDGVIGQVVRALIHIGKDAITAEIVGHATRRLSTEQKATIGNLGGAMPGWLTEFFFSWREFGGEKPVNGFSAKRHINYTF